MSEQSDLALAADLISQTSAEVEVLIKSLNKKVKIKRATVGDLADIMKVAKDQEIEVAVWLIFKCLVNPRMDMPKVRQLDPRVAMEIAQEISKLSGLGQTPVSNDFLQASS